MKTINTVFLSFLTVWFLIGIWSFGFCQRANNSDYDLNRLEYKIQRINVRNINRGGCGLFSLYIANYLDSLEIPYDIVYITQNKNFITPNHIVIKLKDENFYIDSYGFFKSSYLWFYGSCITYHSKADLINIVYNSNQWNPLFDRNDTVQIKKILFNERR